MNIKPFLEKLQGWWQYMRSRDITFWSVISTLFLVIITFYLALATKEMAGVMSKDYQTRTTPAFRLNTPSLTTNDTQTVIEFSIANTSEGVAKRTIHNVILENHQDQLMAVENVIVGQGQWAKKLNQIPINYVFKTQENIKLDWLKDALPANQIKSITIVLTYETLFDRERHVYAEGFLYEFGHNNFDPMTEDRLSQILKQSKAQGLIKMGAWGGP